MASLLVLNSALLLAGSALVVSCLRIRTRSGFLLGLYVVAFSQLVLIEQIAGLLSVLTRGAVLALQVLAAAAAAIVWVRSGRPPLLAAFQESRAAAVFSIRAVRAATSHALITLLVVGAGVLLCWQAVLVLSLPPDNYDSLVYHLSRVGYWLQYRSFCPWPTPTLHQTTFPMNAELAVLWTVLWWGTDQLAGFVQWVAVLATMLGIYGLARLLGCSRPQSALPALLFPTLTQVLYQSSTTQNDVVTASFWAVSLYFLFGSLRQQNKGSLYLSAAALGLALGAKSTSLMVLPGLALALALICFVLQRRDISQRQMVLQWAVACVLGFAVLGSYTYVQNVIAFGHPLGARNFYSGILYSEQSNALPRRVEYLRDNPPRYLYQLVDFSPLPSELARTLNPAKAAIFSALYEPLGISLENPDTIRRYTINYDYINPMNEGGAWFGPLMVLVIPAVLLEGVRGIRRGDALRLTLALLPVSFLVVHSAAQPWTDAKGRYYMIAVALALPLIARLLSSDKIWARLLRLLAAVVGLAVAVTVALRMESSYTFSWDAVWRDPGVPRFDNTLSGRMVMENVPANASIAVASYSGFMDYPLFGEHLTRRVTLGLPDGMESSLPRGDMSPYERAFATSDFLFMPRSGSLPAAVLAERGYALLSQSGSESLWARTGVFPPDSCAAERWPFSTFIRTSTEAVCPTFPITVPPGLSAEDGAFAPLLEPGPGGELSFGLLVHQPATASLAVDLDPGSFKRRQLLEVTVELPGGGAQHYSIWFKGRETIRLDLTLLAGSHNIELALADGSRAATLRGIRIDAK